MVLVDEQFSFSASQDGKVFISWRGKPVTILKGSKAAAFTARVSGKTDAEKQLEMAKVTGNFRRGNEHQTGD